MNLTKITLQFSIVLLVLCSFISTGHAQQRDTFPSEKEILQMKVELYDAGKYLDKSSGGLTIGAIFSTLGLGTMVYGLINDEKGIALGGAGVNVLGIIIMATTAGPLTKAGAALKRAGARKK